ncbi:MAG: hypothetical protein R6V12_20075 [Candidatus Hydrogenedentota bacterium]
MPRTMANYRYLYDETYALQAARKYQRRRISWYFGMAFVAFIALMFLIAAIGTAVTEKQWFPAVLAALFVLAILCARPIEIWFLKRKLRKLPLYKEEVEFTLTPEGVNVITPKSDSTLDWQMWVKARRVRGGFLLYQYPDIYFWLSDDSLVEGTVEGVDALFRENIHDYKPIRRGLQ